jgi:hypothetical protein
MEVQMNKLKQMNTSAWKERQSHWVRYAGQYKCTVAEAIGDRDLPMNRQTCIDTFEAATGRLPTDTEIAAMRPDSDEALKQFNEEYRRSMADWE